MTHRTLPRVATAPRQRTSRARRAAAFTLVELMVVVGIVGVLASVAVPAFSQYTRRSKAAEPADNLKSLFTSLATYYNQARFGQGLGGAGLTGSTHCTVANQAAVPAVPGDQKQLFVPPAGSPFTQVGFTINEPVYFSYAFDGVGAGCGLVAAPPVGAPPAAVYTLTARGDLDGDAVTSTVELAVGVDSTGSLMRSGAFFKLNELE